MNRIVTVIALAASLLAPPLGVARAADPTALQRQVYAEVNKALPYMDRQTLELELPEAQVPPEVTAWRQDGTIRKITIVYPGDHGQTVQEFYFEAASAMMVFAYEAVTTESIDGSQSSTEENRFYFRDGKLFRWLDGSKQPVPPDSPEFAAREADISDTVDTALVQLDGGSGGSDESTAPPEPTGPATDVTGIFSGIEQGDYSYLLLKVGGEERSYMILQTDATLDRILEDPDSYVGRRLRVTRRSMMEDIPQAGGRIEVDEVQGVTLLD